MKALLPITLLLLARNLVSADPAPKAGPVVQTKQSSASTGSLPAKAAAPKRRSVFAASMNDHNPFWPIGWVKTEAVAGDTSAPLVPRAEDFSVSCILLNEPPMAVINGKEMAEGEVAAIPVGSQAVMVQLIAVQDGRIILRWQNQNLTVPLHRQEEISSAAIAAP